MFNPARLTLARRRRGRTKTRLAADVGLTLRSITALEAGESEPSHTTQEALAKALDFPLEFFHGPVLEIPTSEAVSFRALKSMTASQRDSALGAGALAIEASRWIDERFTLPGVDVPDFSELDPETAADAVRAHWGLGQRPIRNMVHLLEAHGVRVFSLDEENQKVDAFSLWWGTTPYVFLNMQKSAERSRMDAAHELGHLVLHHESKRPPKLAEQQAKKFGSAFLMPRADVLAKVSGLVTIERLVKLKKNWNVSAAALCYRLHDVGLVSDWQYRSLFSEMGTAGYLREEPNSVPRETSQILEKVFENLRQAGTGSESLTESLCVYPEEIRKLVFGLVMLPVQGGRTDKARATDQRRPILKVLGPTKP